MSGLPIPVARLLDLVVFDTKLIAMEKQVAKFDSEVSEQSRARDLLEDSLEKTHNLVLNAKKEVDAAELEMQVLDQKEKEKRAKLEYASNPREYNSLKREIEHVARQQHDYEQSLLDRWKRLEDLTQEYEKKKLYTQEEEHRLDVLIADLIQKKEALVARHKQEAVQRINFLQGIAPEWLERYEIMRSQVANPIVPLVGHSCSVCYYPLVHDDIRKLKSTGILQCKECFRFLYEKPEEHGE